MADNTGIVIGSFYEAPGGEIARTHGWDGRTRIVSYAFDDGQGPRHLGEDEMLAGWKRRPDLSDFPAARDPMLPSVFDLVWDVKRRSELVDLLGRSEDEDELSELMAENGVVLDPDEVAAVERIRADRANDEAMGMAR